MSTLLMRLAAPLQSWGLEDKFERRGTSREPTKSGVLGLLASALGISRDNTAALNNLCALRFGVRIDQPGQLMRDFHTARVLGEKNSYISNRYYLCDAVFIAGVESEDENLLRSLDQALKNPVFPLFLGRRSCPPEGELSLGLKDAPLETALRSEAWRAGEAYKRREKKATLTLVLDAEEPGILRRRDIPLSFSQAHRKHTFRYVDDIPNTVPVDAEAISGNTRHDPFINL
ncbi:MAG: type I-E CRISPR-associated protein Cas5/CasD [Clostridiales bacterium]|jgi:CRISPR system Cascade subunit CasD|nr:type I-E CRISPR-associated protein Cas5/CasD [Clostridiales bacterium]